MYEFNEAARGYWRNWERNTAWLSREIVFELINGNPYYESGKKPRTKMAYMRLSTDKEDKKVEKKVSKEELKIVEDRLKGIRDGAVKKSSGKN